jgi:hypothetical protein
MTMARQMGLCATVALAATCAGSASAAPPALHVSGNKLVNASGATVRLKGMNIPSLEWSNGGENVMQSVNTAINTWKATLIRLPVSQDRWWGAAASDWTGPDNVSAYRGLVDQVISTASAAGCYVLVDLHWSDEGVWGANMAQHDMPDNNTSPVWNDIASRYKNNPAVLFDAYNEPHDVSWSVWRNGGWVSEGNGYNTPGMQSIVNTIRGTGAQNVIVVGGLDWAYDLTGVANGYAISSSNIMYGAHVYPWKSNWDQYVSVAAGSNPILIGEFGDNSSDNYTSWMPSILGWMDSHNYSATAWSFHPTSTPCLISDWNYTPTYWFGTYVKTWMASGGSTGGTTGGTTGGGGGSISNGAHTLTPQCATGSRLDDNAAGTTNGNKVQIWTANGTAAQQWNFTSVNGNSYTIATNVNTGYCLDDSAAGATNGNVVQLWQCNGTGAQQWNATQNGNGTWTFSPQAASGYCLDVNGAGTTDGTAVQIWQCNGTNAQQWGVN